MSCISFVLPAYNEEANLGRMVDRIESVAETLAPDEVEIVFVDDHSTDGTPGVLRVLCRENPRVRAARLARRSGSHVAILCGTKMARGDCAIVLAADGQDAPELASAMIGKWRDGNQVVWGVRRNYRRSVANKIFAGLFYWLMRRVSNMSPESQNADVVLLDRRVIDVLSTVYERNMYLWGLIDWLGYKQTAIEYDKSARLSGTSGWTFFSKLKVAIDSLVAFSYVPIRIMSLLGLVFSSLAFAAAVILVLNSVTGGLLFGPYGVPGWASIVCAVFFLGGMQMLMLGVLGEYLWRTFDQVRGRPLYLVEEGMDAAEPRKKPAHSIEKQVSVDKQRLDRLTVP